MRKYDLQFAAHCLPRLVSMRVANQSRTSHALIVGVSDLQPSRNLLGRPLERQFTRHRVAQPTVQSEAAGLGPKGRSCGLIVSVIGPIAGAAAVPGGLPAHRRGRAS